jgi:hypothetical protein
VPRLSEFYGIVIYMFWNDHEPAHFHAIYSGDEALVRIDDGTILAGSLPRTTPASSRSGYGYTVTSWPRIGRALELVSL